MSHYLGHRKADGQSSRGILGRVQRQLAAFARRRHRQDLAELFLQPAAARHQHARAVARALELLPTLPEPQPLIGDDIDQWLPPRTVRALRAEGIKTLAALTLRIPRRRRWWSVIPGLGAAGATQVEAFFAAHPELTERARAPLVLDEPRDVVPWERLIVPADVDGSRGTFRAPVATCTLGTRNDYEAVQAWLALHESAATQRAYRKEAERLMLWCGLQHGVALSDLTHEDLLIYQRFLADPQPAERWVMAPGQKPSRTSLLWRPFAGPLGASSQRQALSILNAMLSWLVGAGYLAGNPLALSRRKRRHAAPRVSRFLPMEHWTVVKTTIEAMPVSGRWQANVRKAMWSLTNVAPAWAITCSYVPTCATRSR